MDHCQSIINRIQTLEDQVTALEELLPGATTSQKQDIMRRIRDLMQQIGQAQRELDACERSPSYIAGIEQTQAIQFWNFPDGQGSGYGPDNSVALFSGKPTMLRVYLDAPPGGPAQLTGTLVITGPAGTTTLTPQNGPLARKPAASIVRASIDDTLNFVIPRTSATGALNCALTITDPATGKPVDRETVVLRFVDVPQLPVHSVLVHYTGVDFFD